VGGEGASGQIDEKKNWAKFPCRKGWGVPDLSRLKVGRRGGGKKRTNGIGMGVITEKRKNVRLEQHLPRVQEKKTSKDRKNFRIKKRIEFWRATIQGEQGIR